MKIRARSVGTFILALSILKPVGIDAFSPVLNLLFNAMKLVAMIYLFVVLIDLWLNKHNIDFSINILFVIEIVTVLVSIFNNFSPYSAIVFWQSIISLMILAETYTDKNLLKFIDVLLLVFKLYVIIDLLTICLWNNGYNDTRLYFLGNKNMHILYLLPMLILILFQGVVYDYKKFDIKNILWWAISFFIVFKTGSSTSIIALMLITIYYLIFYKNKFDEIFANFPAKIVGTIIIFVGTLVVFIGTRGILSFLVTDVFGKELTLTGRTLIWPRAIQIIKENPFGYGWDALISHIGYGELANWNVGHAHNLILTIWYKCGIIGLVFFVTYIFYIFYVLDKHNCYIDVNLTNTLKMYIYIFMTISILDAYPTNCIGLFFICYLIVRISKINKPIVQY